MSILFLSTFMADVVLTLGDIELTVQSIKDAAVYQELDHKVE